jgi:FMN phosphatase YigB (HAD superfamily)
LIILAEIGYEKPSREIFEAALNELGVDASVAMHVGDGSTNDKQGALATGLESWLWKVDVKSFGELADRILQPVTQ